MIFCIAGNGLLKLMGVESAQRHMSADGTEAPRKPWIFRWLNDETDEQRVIDLKEREEREDILRRVRLLCVLCLSKCVVCIVSVQCVYVTCMLSVQVCGGLLCVLCLPIVFQTCVYCLSSVCPIVWWVLVCTVSVQFVQLCNWLLYCVCPVCPFRVYVWLLVGSDMALWCVRYKRCITLSHRRYQTLHSTRKRFNVS